MVIDVLQPLLGRNSMHNAKFQNTRSLRTEKRVTDFSDCVLPDSHISSQKGVLFVFEDTVAVIKMIIEGRSPSMRHISRTCRARLGSWFDRINLDLGIRITYVDTSEQIADTLTKGSFTRERWRQLTQLFMLMIPHTHFCIHSLVFSFVQKDDRMSKRLPELVTKSATAKQRLVRNFCAYSHHSLSSSSSSIYPMQNPAGRNSDQDANGVDSQKHLQRTQHSE